MEWLKRTRCTCNFTYCFAQLCVHFRLAHLNPFYIFFKLAGFFISSRISIALFCLHKFKSQPNPLAIRWNVCASLKPFGWAFDHPTNSMLCEFSSCYKRKKKKMRDRLVQWARVVWLGIRQSRHYYLYIAYKIVTRSAGKILRKFLRFDVEKKIEDDVESAIFRNW